MQIWCGETDVKQCTHRKMRNGGCWQNRIKSNRDSGRREGHGLYHGSGSDANGPRTESTIKTRSHWRMARPMVPTKISQMFAPAPEQSMSIRNRPTLPAKIATKPHKTQRTITSAGKLGPEVEDWTEQKKVTGNKKNTNNHQLTLQESWNLPEASKTKTRVPNGVGKKRKAERNASPHKRRRGNRMNTCHKCNLRGALIECHTCIN